MEKIKIIITDDHQLFRNGLKILLNAFQEFEVAGEASNGEEFLRLLKNTPADVVLMDINMPGMNGIDATRAILQHNPEAGIVMVTMLEDDASVFAAMRAGARGYLLKGADQNEIVLAITPRIDTFICFYVLVGVYAGARAAMDSVRRSYLYAFAAAMGMDKKRVASDIEMPVVTSPGRCALSSYVTGQSPNTVGVCSPPSAVRWQEDRDGGVQARRILDQR